MTLLINIINIVKNDKERMEAEHCGYNCKKSTSSRYTRHS